MDVIVSLLRGINVGGHHKIKMDALRTLYKSLGLRDPQTYIQSGNVIFRTEGRDLAKLVKRIENAIEETFGFRAGVIMRTCCELKDVVARNPFAARENIDPRKLLVTFLAGDPGQRARDELLSMRTDPEELRIDGRYLYIYFPNGMARPRLSSRVRGRSRTGPRGVSTPGLGSAEGAGRAPSSAARRRFSR